MARHGVGATKPSTPAAPTSTGWLATEPPSPIRARTARPERRLEQECGEGGAGVKKAEEAHERLARSEPGDRFRLEQVIHQRGKHGGERDHEREVPQQGHAPDLDPSAPAIRPALCARARRAGIPRPMTTRTGHTDARRQCQQREERSLRHEDRHALRADAAGQAAKAAAAATRAMSGLAACGSKRSLSNDQNAEIPIAPSTLAWT